MRRLTCVLLLIACRPLPATRGAACDEVIDAYCDRGIDCGIVVNPATGCAIEGQKADCCARDGRCDATAVDPGSALQCADGIRSSPCSSRENGRVPASCASAADVKDMFNPPP